MSDYTFPWPEEGAVIIQQPGDPGVRDANYARARACVHACEGIPTEVLENAFLLRAFVQDRNGKVTEHDSERYTDDGQREADEEGSTT